MSKAKQVPRTIREADTVSITLTQAGSCSVKVDGREVLVVRKVTNALQAWVHPASAGKE